MNIYAILKKDNKIKKISITQKLQEGLTSYMENFIDKFFKLEFIEFSVEYKPEENQVLYIENFQNPYTDFNPTSIEILQKDEIRDIKTIFFDYEDKISYQCFDSRKIIEPSKWLLIYSKNTFCKFEKAGLIIDSKIDALYQKEGKKLSFPSYHNASKIFSNLNNYYREATDDEINDFFKKNNKIQIDKSFDISILNSRMRKKLHLIINNKIIDKIYSNTKNFDNAKNYAKNFELETMFDEDNKKIIFPSEKENLENLLKFLNDDFFQSPITKSKYETNSKRKINEKTN
ncbi:MAG: hypothetical protein ABIN11_02315 [candidate division WOR-3 bacterium]